MDPEIKPRQKERMRVYHKEYYQRPEVKKHKREYMKEYMQRPKVKTYYEEYNQRSEVKKRIRDYYRDYNQRPEVKNRRNESRREHNTILRRQFFEMYGGVCMCCGKKDIRFLTLDHVNGDGAKDRRGRSQETILREALSDLNTEKYQILCYNCNMGRSINNGICPHSPHKPETSIWDSTPFMSKGKRQRRNLRKRLFEVYGSVCACCGESEERFLTLDHKLNDGNHARKESKDIKIMRKAISEADPRKYQILCFNCNCARSQHNGICPHHDVK